MPTEAATKHEVLTVLGPMCGRYTSTRKGQELIDAFDIAHDATGGELVPDYNVAPTKPVPVVLSGTRGASGVRELWIARWGLVPHWARDVSIGSRLINARAESVHEKPAFRRAFARRRCLIPADGYYEWAPDRQPYFIRPGDGSGMAMAGLYEVWRGAGEQLLTCTIITTQASTDVGNIHDRMPVLVDPQRYEAWLDPALTDPDEVRGLLLQPAPGRLTAYAVSTAVNKVINNGPELVEPVSAKGIPSESSPTLF